MLGLAFFIRDVCLLQIDSKKRFLKFVILCVIL
jgi:hypothetical protein